VKEIGSFQSDYAGPVRAGRAYVRLIEAAAVLIEWEEDERSRRRLAMVRHRCQEALRQLVATLPTHVTAQILAASEKALGTIKDVTKN
jgi:hypothetical protein